MSTLCFVVVFLFWVFIVGFLFVCFLVFLGGHEQIMGILYANFFICNEPKAALFL